MNLLTWVLLTMISLTTHAAQSTATAHALRLVPGEDPKAALLNYAKLHKLKAASVVSAVGSLKTTVLRYANQPTATTLEGFREVLSLSGTFSDEAAHLHLSVADEKGAVLGGHLADGSKVYTTLELVILVYPELVFARETDPKTTFKELVIKKK